MTGLRHIAVVDVGKTNVKVALVDLDGPVEVSVVTRPNVVRPGPPYPHFDTDGHWEFILGALSQMQLSHGIDAISVTTHGASAALLASDGSLAAPILDYEHNGPDSVAPEYDRLRPPFAQTGSPRLAGGLNVGAQLYWQFAADATLRGRTAHIVTYPQYWGHRLTGVAASDVTSIGCHTDLWEPRAGRLSSLAQTLGIADKIAPTRKSGDLLGPILPEIAARTGLGADTPVACGIHDSNASLLPYVLSCMPPFSVVSTGTWVVVMCVGGTDTGPDPDRDALLNVNAFGQVVPSARFMGGREYDIIGEGCSAEITDAAVAGVLSDEVMMLPSVVPGTGPFQGRIVEWIGGEPVVGSPDRMIALSLYLAMMTATCLDVAGGQGVSIVEGPFAQNLTYLQMLAAATGRPVQRTDALTGTAVGAALLFAGDHTDVASRPVAASPNAAAMERYATRWRQVVVETG